MSHPQAKAKKEAEEREARRKEERIREAEERAKREKAEKRRAEERQREKEAIPLDPFDPVTHLNNKIKYSVVVTNGLPRRMIKRDIAALFAPFGIVKQIHAGFVVINGADNKEHTRLQCRVYYGPDDIYSPLIAASTLLAKHIYPPQIGPGIDLHVLDSTGTRVVVEDVMKKLDEEMHLSYYAGMRGAWLNKEELDRAMEAEKKAKADAAKAALGEGEGAREKRRARRKAREQAKTSILGHKGKRIAGAAVSGEPTRYVIPSYGSEPTTFAEMQTKCNQLEIGIKDAKRRIVELESEIDIRAQSYERRTKKLDEQLHQLEEKKRRYTDTTRDPGEPDVESVHRLHRDVQGRVAQMSGWVKQSITLHTRSLELSLETEVKSKEDQLEGERDRQPDDSVQVVMQRYQTIVKESDWLRTEVQRLTELNTSLAQQEHVLTQRALAMSDMADELLSQSVREKQKLQTLTAEKNKLKANLDRLTLALPTRYTSPVEEPPIPKANPDSAQSEIEFLRAQVATEKRVLEQEKRTQARIEADLETLSHGHGPIIKVVNECLASIKEDMTVSTHGTFGSPTHRASRTKVAERLMHEEHLFSMLSDVLKAEGEGPSRLMVDELEARVIFRGDEE
ncbi:hypothetical protein KIPB_005174 [Kipferlia bialata]|uniref:Uncharacterized protein n=1 Tax=Kipferlia bialata TaxID=797122 RepID=A0A9K3GIU7_9EUKA|nr:hypothetical protein KIPB_005174 [Kipferlia bialata]|eukprot:g5174.t1